MKKLPFVILTLLLCTTLGLTQEPIYDHFVYLPMIKGREGTAVPMVRPTLAPPTPTPSTVRLPTPTAVITDYIALLADTQNCKFSVQQEVITSLVARHNSILVMAGDVVCLKGCTDMQCADERYTSQLEILEPLESLEWHFSPGNHDYASGIELGTAAWEKWIGERYHTFDTTHACFFMVDDQLWDVEQEQWLSTSIAQCTKPWRILVKHFPMPYGIEPYSDRNFERYAGLDVDLIIAGHRHQVMVWRTGTVLNVVLPSAAGVWLPKNAPAPVAGDEVITSFPIAAVGFGEMEIGPEALTWYIYRWDGLLLLKGEDTVAER